jgi:hypothetical protein
LPPRRGACAALSCSPPIDWRTRHQLGRQKPLRRANDPASDRRADHRLSECAKTWAANMAHRPPNMAHRPTKHSPPPHRPSKHSAPADQICRTGQSNMPHRPIKYAPPVDQICPTGQSNMPHRPIKCVTQGRTRCAPAARPNERPLAEPACRHSGRKNAATDEQASQPPRTKRRPAARTEPGDPPKAHAGFTCRRQTERGGEPRRLPPTAGPRG